MPQAGLFPSPYGARQGRTVSGHHGLSERLLLQVPIGVSVALGLILMLSRFFQVLHDDLRHPPDGWPSVMLLALIVGAMAFLIVLGCAAAGAIIGVILRALFAGARLGGRQHAHSSTDR
jgi:hypothetical protein